MPLISVITDTKNRITKKFGLDPDGKLDKFPPEHLDDGTIETLNLTPTQLLATVKELTQHQCICLGMTSEPGKHTIKASHKAKAGDLTRTKADLSFSSSMQHYLLLDFDDCGMSAEQAYDELVKIDSQIESAGVLMLPSSSSYIYTGNGKEMIGAGNFHLYLTVEGDPTEYGKTLFQRLILAGHGKPFIAKNGTVKVRSLFDGSVMSPEREIFVAEPVFENGLHSTRLQYAEAHDGELIDTSKLQPLSKEEFVELYLIEDAIRTSVSDMSEKMRAAYNEERAAKRAALKGTSKLMELASINDAPVSYDRLGRPVMELLSSELIMDQDGSLFQVVDLLINPQPGKRLPDIVDPYTRGNEKKGIPGRGIATVLDSMIFSHAAGGQIFLLRWAVDDLLSIFDRSSTKYDDDTRRFVWKAITTGVQLITSTADEGQLSELADVVRAAMKGKGAGSEKRPIVAKLKAAAKPQQAEVEDPIVKYNARYGMVNIGGRVVIISEEWNPQGNIFDIQYTQPNHLDTLTRNEPIAVPGVPGGKMPLYRYWEQHKERNTFDTVVFSPNSDPKKMRRPGVRRTMQQGGVYNLWQGYILDPDRATSCEKIKAHIKDVWCSGIEEEYNYVIAWLAHLFQRPGDVSTTALVLQSKQGSGKGMIIDKVIVETFGVHAISTANREDVVGRFNAHMGLNCFIYANEFAYAAENASKSLLKTLLTDEHRMIEAKNVNKIKARNCTSAIFSSNDDWLLAVEYGDRRYVYLTTSNKRKGDHEYFNALAAEIENGGREAFVLWLLNYDYSKVNLKVIPNPDNSQKKADLIRTAHPLVQFVYTIADLDNDLNMLLTCPCYPKVKSWRDGKGNLSLTKTELFELYIQYAEYFKINRQYDNLTNILIHLKSGGILTTDAGANEAEFVATLEKKQKRKTMVVFKEIGTAAKLLGL